MTPDTRFTNVGWEFWANVKLLNQRIGYFERKKKSNPNPDFVVPTVKQIKRVFADEGLDHSKLIDDQNNLTEYGQKLIGYMEYRKYTLNNHVRPNLMDAAQAKELFDRKRQEINPPEELLPMNKQKGDKNDFAFLTGLVNMMIYSHKNQYDCDYDPRELTAITHNGYPVRTLSRRVDGAFPDVINPIAIWEIKEYYYTTTFGSRIADGVYETMLDGYELEEASTNVGVDVKHYLFIDAYLTWWDMGKSYLCRLVDIMHMGLVNEVIVGREVVTRLPELVDEWVAILDQSDSEEEAIAAANFPRYLGKHNDINIIVDENENAFYVKYVDGVTNKCVMVPKTVDPRSITLEQAKRLLDKH